LRQQGEAGISVDLVGSRPAAAVRDLARIHGVALHADVSDVAPFHAKADAAVIPLRAGGGSRIKLLEAFAFGTPVIASSIAARGFDVVDGEHLLVADGAGQAAGACVRLFRDPGLGARLAASARQLLHAAYSGSEVGRSIRAMVGEARARAGETSR
jgi:glycosyltransferase involved in cell wall biosynthesis